ncbi:MAG: putative PEP-binding protein, partial [bacterium]
QSVGSKIGAGKVEVIKNVEDISKFDAGKVLVTEMTDPDWEPIMKKAAAIVTNSGGRTCFTESTIILTDKGFLTIKEIVTQYKSENIKVLSINKNKLKLEWKNVVDSMVREGKPIEVSISQTGRMKNNTLGITPDHKILTFDNRKLIAKEIHKIIEKKEYLLTPIKIPDLVHQNKGLPESLAYLLGGILTDGNIYLTETHGEVQFIQKPVKAKEAFIEKMKHGLKENFNYDFRTFIKKESLGMIRGKEIKGNANAYRCYSKSIAAKIKDYENDIVNILLRESEKFLYNFLAGVIDGDGAYANNRINVFCSEKNLENALVICLLKLGINFQITNNRNISNIQIVDNIENIFQHTQRVKGIYNRICNGIKLFSAKQLLEDIAERVNYKGRILPYIKNNLLIDSLKIKNYLIPMIKGELQNHELTDIVNSDLRMLRVKLTRQLPKQNVYNITVEDNHNYVVFTDKMTPILVNNCHAAIVSRELGIPCVVGTVNGTEKIKNKQEVTVSCAEGERGFVYEGILPFEIKKTNLKNLKKPKTKIMMNLGEPDQAFTLSFIPNDGIGLAREEFIINNYIGIHPLALIEIDRESERVKKVKKREIGNCLPAEASAQAGKLEIGNFDKERVKLTGSDRKKIEELTVGYTKKTDFYVDRLAEGIAKIAAAFYPKDVIVRFSDFKSNEYANLIGGKYFEPIESNPMIGWRGASRYYDPKFRPAFELECKAIRKVRDGMKLTNVKVMIPFCRTIEEGLKVLEILAQNKLYGKSYIEYLRKNKNKIPKSFTSNPELVGKPSFLKELFVPSRRSLLKGTAARKTNPPQSASRDCGGAIKSSLRDFGGTLKDKLLDVYVMCEIPSDVILAEEFAKIFDGFSIGSNDLTQLALGVDRDSELVSHVYDERNAAVKEIIREVITVCRRCNTKIGICGQAPSDFPDFAKFLVEQKIDSISLTPDTVLKLTLELGKKKL